MKLRLFAVALAALSLLATPEAGFAQRGRVAVHQRDWSLVAVRTPEGGVRIGNPAAPVKLVEYGSITCPHCAAFSAEGAQALRARYVRPGRVSWEYRPYLIFPTDPGVFMLLNCLGPSRFFAATDALYATQRAWVGRLQSVPSAQLEQMSSLPPNQQAAALVRAAGLEPFFRARGLTPAQMNACLANRAGIERLAGIARQANALGVQGTPTFFINGRSVGTQDWARLEPMLTGR